MDNELLTQEEKDIVEWITNKVARLDRELAVIEAQIFAYNEIRQRIGSIADERKDK